MPDPEDDERDEDRPRRRRRRDDDDYDHDHPRRRPKKKGGMPVIAIVLIVLFGVGVVGCGALALLLPAIQRVREAAARTQDQNNLARTMKGVHNYASANQDQLPPAQEQVSWRVHLLPYIEQQNVYRRMDVTQPWDAPVNKPFANQKIPTYVSAADPPGTVDTRYRVFVGPNTLYSAAGGKAKYNISNIPDGTSNTIFAVEAGELVPWPQPKELPYDRKAPLPALGVPGRKGFNAALADGSVRFISDRVSHDVLRRAIEPDDGQIFNLDP